jgi:hypothetical protein
MNERIGLEDGRGIEEEGGKSIGEDKDLII